MLTSATLATSGLEVVDDLSAPTIFVDSFSGIISIGGAIVFGCCETVLVVESDSVMTPKRKVVLRLAIPVGSLPGLADMLQAQVALMVKDGVLNVGEMGALKSAGTE